jgi:hypothetical protein
VVQKKALLKGEHIFRGNFEGAVNSTVKSIEAIWVYYARQLPRRRQYYHFGVEVNAYELHLRSVWTGKVSGTPVREPPHLRLNFIKIAFNSPS